MSILLIVIGTLALTSGGFRLRRGDRRGWVDLAAGLGTVIATGLGVAATRALAWPVAFLTVGVVAVSAWQSVRSVIQAQQDRAQSEEARLASYLQVDARARDADT